MKEESLRKRFKVGQTVYWKRFRYFGNRAGHELVPLVIKKVGTKYLSGEKWFEDRVHPSSVYLSVEDYEAEQLNSLANSQFKALFAGWASNSFTTEQIRLACAALGVSLPSLASDDDKTSGRRPPA